MTKRRKASLVAGIAIIIMAVVAALTYGYLHRSVVVPVITENPITNLNNLNSLIIAEIAGWLIILILDVIVAVALYLFFKKENRKLSVTAAWLRMIFVVVFGVAIFSFISILKIIKESPATAPGMINQNILAQLDSFENTWSIALIIFGFHLFLLGILAFKSRSIHRIWGILLVFAAVSYILVHSSKQIFPEHDNLINTIETLLSLPMAIGEVGFAFWLVILGGKPKKVYPENL